MRKKGFHLIEINGDVYEVEGNYNDFRETNKKFTKNKGYIYEDGLVYIYGGKDKGVKKPGHFYRSPLDPEFIELVMYDTEEALELYHHTKIIDTATIAEKMGDDNAFKEVDQDMIDTSELKIFSPPIKDDDDVYKKIIKQALIQKQIDLKQYRAQFSNEYDLTNLKASLSKPGVMSIKNFNRWCEILGLTVTITVTNSGTDKNSRLREPIII